MGNTKVNNSGKTKGITGSTLKIIAIVTMLIDHVGAFILEKSIAIQGLYSCATELEQDQWVSEHALLVCSDTITRLIGRIAFPIYIFLLIEGYSHTRSKAKYAIRLLIFSIISEIPFDLAYTGDLFNNRHQNVFFTLFLGLLAIWTVDVITNKLSGKYKTKIMNIIILFAAGLVFSVIAIVLRTDYSAFGVIAIIVMHYFRENREWSVFLSLIVLIVHNFMEAVALLIIPLIKVYNGKRGLKLKYIFYVIYPLHLLIYYLIIRFLGLL